MDNPPKNVFNETTFPEITEMASRLPSPPPPAREWAGR